jgi:hypothetical protein
MRARGLQGVGLVLLLLWAFEVLHAALVALGDEREPFQAAEDFGESFLVGGESALVVALHGGDDFDGLG